MQHTDDMQLKRFWRQRGMTLTEAILAMTVAVLMMVMMARMQAAATADLRAKNTAESLQSFTQMSGQYFLANASEMMEAMKSGTGAANHCVLGANISTGSGGTTANNTTLHTCALDGNWLKYKKVIPLNFSDVNAYGQKWTAVFRMVYSGGNPTGDVELLVVGAQTGTQIAADGRELGLAAEIMGANGGFVPSSDWGACKYSASAKEACGTGGGWKANLADFLNSP